MLRTLEATGNVNSSKDWSLGDFVRLVLPLGNAPKACPAAFGFGSSYSDNHAPTSPTLILKKTWGLEQKGIQYGNLNSVNPTTPSIHRPYTFPSLERSFGPSVRTRYFYLVFSYIESNRRVLLVRRPIRDHDASDGGFR